MATTNDLRGKTVIYASLTADDDELMLEFTDGTQLIVEPQAPHSPSYSDELELHITLKEI